LQNGINWVNNGDLTFKDFMKINFKHADQQTMRIMLYKKGHIDEEIQCTSVVNVHIEDGTCHIY